MTSDERQNEFLKARAGFLNALAVGSIVAGALQALDSENLIAVIVFMALGLVLHLLASDLMETMRVSDG